MAEKSFPGPSINRLIDGDPQIVKVPLDYMGFGSRPSALPKPGDPKQINQDGTAPTAPEMTIKHTG